MAKLPTYTGDESCMVLNSYLYSSSLGLYSDNRQSTDSWCNIYESKIVEGNPNPPPLLFKSIFLWPKARPLDDLHHPSKSVISWLAWDNYNMSNQFDLMSLLHICTHACYYIPQFKLLKIGCFVHGFCNGYCSFGLDRVLSNTVNRSKNISSPQHTMTYSSTNTHSS